MKELSLNILDIVQNSISAGADMIEILLTETEDKLLTLTIRDNGHGMSKDALKKVTDPFYTTRKTRKIGMGIPLLKFAAEMAGGKLTVESVSNDENCKTHGTSVTATFHTDSIDFTPIGDIISTVRVIIHGHPEIDYFFRHVTPSFDVSLDTKKMREVLGSDISLSKSEILEWIEGNLKQQYQN